MSRILFALCLVLFAVPAAAAESAASESAAETCPKAEAHADKPGEEAAAPAQRPGTPAPVRARSTSGVRSGPRWHSLLPGMIR